jgi:hypothetical protein
MQLSSPKKKKRSCKHKPIWPMNAVSIKEAIGSAAKASAAGIAICAISSPNSSFLKTLLAKQLGNKMLDFIKSSLTFHKVTINLKNQKETDLLKTKKKNIYQQRTKSISALFYTWMLLTSIGNQKELN